jgi:hypothetical protein
MGEQGELESRWALVSSFFGPGPVLAWVLGLISVVISWTINKKHRTSDSTNVDLAVALIFPAVAAVHAIYHIIHFDFRSSGVVFFDNYYDLSHNPQVATDGQRSEFTMQQHIEVIRTSIAICFIFHEVGIILLYIADETLARQIAAAPQSEGQIPKEAPLKRAVLVSLIWLVCAFAAMLYYLIAPKDNVLETFWAPLLNFAVTSIRQRSLGQQIPTNVASIMGFTLWFCWGMIWIVQAYATLRMARFIYARHNSKDDVKLGSIWLSAVRILVRSSLETMGLEKFGIHATIVYIIFFLSLWVALFAPFGVSYLRSSAYIPLSSFSLSELDQAAALAVGCVTFLYFLRDVIKPAEASTGTGQ